MTWDSCLVLVDEDDRGTSRSLPTLVDSTGVVHQPRGSSTCAVANLREENHSHSQPTQRLSPVEVDFPLDAAMSEACGQELRDLLTSTSVEQLTISTRPTLSPSDSIADAVAEMRIHSHGSAVICDNDRLVGIFTERDMLRVLATGIDLNQPLSTVMTSEPHTLQADAKLSDVIASMYRGGYRRLPVVNQDHQPIGIIDVKAVVQFLVEHFPEAVYNQASHVHSIARHPEGA